MFVFNQVFRLLTLLYTQGMGPQQSVTEVGHKQGFIVVSHNNKACKIVTVHLQSAL